MVSKYADVFPKKHTFLAVVHVEDAEQALRNVAIARDGGADGVFLINHGMDAMSLLACYRSVRETHSDWWIGMNMLDLEPFRAFVLLPEDCDALWTDSLPPPQTGVLYSFAEMLASRQEVRNMLYFGGVAFKGQVQAAIGPEGAARLTPQFVDVITTSGDATGWPPTVEKIRAIRKGAGDRPVAIASGISAENVEMFKDLANCFLVASSIGKSFSELDADRVREFSREIARLNSAE